MNINSPQSPDPNSNLGKKFWFIAAIVALLLLTLFFDNQLDQQWNPNQELNTEQQYGRQVVRLQRNRAGYYVLNGQINGYPVRFLLDTGATTVSIPAAVADRIGLPRGQQQVSLTASGRTASYSTRIDTLNIGEIILYDVAASILPEFPGEEVLLGMSALRQVEFTQRGEELIIKSYANSY